LTIGGEELLTADDSAEVLRVVGDAGEGDRLGGGRIPVNAADVAILQRERKEGK
jgi:hypothetical protein